MSRKGGIRKRVLGANRDDDDCDDHEAAAASSSRKGGVRRRLIARAEAAASTSVDLPLLRSLKRDWSKGKLTSPQVQEYASGAARQGAIGMSKVAAAGSHGRNPQHLQRSLISLFGMPDGAPPFVWYKIPTAAGDQYHPFLLPHAWIAALYHHRHSLWESAMQGEDVAVVDFWESMATSTIVTKHPHLSLADRARTLPLGLHGDGGAFSKQESLFVFTFNSLLGHGVTSAKRFLLTVIRKCDFSPETLQTIMDILSWSFNVALTGLLPEVDWAGDACEERGYLAGRWRGSLVQVRGDWEFYTSVFRFPAWNAVDEMCWMCRATGVGPLRFTACGADAPWRGTRRSHEEYVEQLAAQGKELPTLLKKVVGLRLESVMIDVLHCVDLGIGAHIVGNVFWACVRKGVWDGTTQVEQVNGLDAELRKHYKDTKEKSRLHGAFDPRAPAHGWWMA